MKLSKPNTRVAIAESHRPLLPPPDAASMLANTVLQLSKDLQVTRMSVAVVPVEHMKFGLTTHCKVPNISFASSERRRTWVAGRIAIRAARRRLGLGAGTPHLRFPNACTSLTHVSGFAVSVAVPEGALEGIGVDLEIRRITTARIERFYLTDGERAALDCRPPNARCGDRLRLWTVKEAVFKACSDNSSLALTSFEVDDPASEQGMAVCRFAQRVGRNLPDPVIHYASSWTPVGCITLATKPARWTLKSTTGNNLSRTARVLPEISTGPVH